MPKLDCARAEKVFKWAAEAAANFDVELKTGRELEKMKNLKGVLETNFQELKKLVWESTPDLELAEKIMGKDFLGPDDVRKAFRTNDPKLNQPPEIPFSIGDLKRARELGHYLILRIDNAHIDNGWLSKNITIERMADFFKKSSLITVSQGSTRDWQEDSLFNRETPKPGWALMSKNIVPETDKENYLEQLRELARYADREFFLQSKTPETFHHIWDNFLKKQKEIQTRESRGRMASGEVTRSLVLESHEAEMLNRALRPTAVELVYDIFVYHQKNEEFLASGEHWIWTASQSHNPQHNHEYITVGTNEQMGFITLNHAYVEHRSTVSVKIGTVISRRF